MRDYLNRQNLNTAKAAIAALQAAGAGAVAARRAITQDPVFNVRENARHRDRAVGQVTDEANRVVQWHVANGRQALAAIQAELADARQGVDRPGPAGDAAGQRVLRLIEAGMPVADLVRRAKEREDQDALEWLQGNVHDLLAAQVAKGGHPDRATGRTVQQQADRLYDAIVAAREPAIRFDQAASEYHSTRREVADLARQLEAVAKVAVKEARGAPATNAKFEAGLAEGRWAEMVSRAEREPDWEQPTGPVEDPIAVAGDA